METHAALIHYPERHSYLQVRGKEGIPALPLPVDTHVFTLPKVDALFSSANVCAGGVIYPADIGEFVEKAKCNIGVCCGVFHPAIFVKKVVVEKKPVFGIFGLTFSTIAEEAAKAAMYKVRSCSSSPAEFGRIMCKTRSVVLAPEHGVMFTQNELVAYATVAALSDKPLPLQSGDSVLYLSTEREALTNWRSFKKAPYVKHHGLIVAVIDGYAVVKRVTRSKGACVVDLIDARAVFRILDPKKSPCRTLKRLGTEKCKVCLVNRGTKDGNQESKKDTHCLA